MEIKDIEKLAKLARIELTETEKQTYLKDLSAILVYVDQIKGAVASVGEERKVGDLRNVMRPDDKEEQVINPPTELIAEFPQKKDNYLKVKKILEN
jgi:aspartyl-tRNA(Asn)/glutamyl-tRNA(Gln) amidotransferase subunit C